MENMYDFGILKTLRRTRNLTLHGLAKACGLTYSTVAGLENNNASPSLKTIDILAKQFDMPTSRFLMLCENPNLVQKTAEIVCHPCNQQGILGLDKCKKVAFGDVLLIRITAVAGDIIKTTPVHPDVFEVCYVLSGKTCLMFKSSETILGCNEAVLFDGSQEHEYQQNDNAEFIVVYIPKTLQGILNVQPISVKLQK